MYHGDMGRYHRVDSAHNLSCSPPCSEKPSGAPNLPIIRTRPTTYTDLCPAQPSSATYPLWPASTNLLDSRPCTNSISLSATPTTHTLANTTIAATQPCQQQDSAEHADSDCYIAKSTPHYPIPPPHPTPTPFPHPSTTTVGSELPPALATHLPHPIPAPCDPSPALTSNTGAPCPHLANPAGPDSISAAASSQGQLLPASGRRLQAAPLSPVAIQSDILRAALAAVRPSVACPCTDPVPGRSPGSGTSLEGEGEAWHSSRSRTRRIRNSSSGSGSSGGAGAEDSGDNDLLSGSLCSAQLFDQLGGWDQLVAGVQQLYQRLGADPATQAFFPDTDLKRLSRHMTCFIGSSLAGKLTYPPAQLWHIHKRLIQEQRLSAQHVDIMCKHLEQVLTAIGVQGDALQAALQCLQASKWIFNCQDSLDFDLALQDNPPSC
ncbi:hypothetical protein V8C86DRAFT_2505633 [Haematococcus lacustris]